MLTIIADAMLTATHRKKWPAPDHWKTGRPMYGASQYEREAALWRRRLQRDVGLW